MGIAQIDNAPNFNEYLVFDRTIRDDTSLFDLARSFNIPAEFLLYSVRDRDDLETFIPDPGT